MPDIYIRKANQDDMDLFDIIRDEKLPELHNSRLKQQEEGIAEYLIAFKNNEPVGHVFVLYKYDVPYYTCPVLQDLFVKKEEREKGVSKKILELTGQRIKEKGFLEMSIEVEEGKEWIRSFYLNVGFELHSGPHEASWVEKDSGKRIYTNLYYLIKTL